MSALPLKADIHHRGLHVRFVPEADLIDQILDGRAHAAPSNERTRERWQGERDASMKKTSCGWCTEEGCLDDPFRCRSLAASPFGKPPCPGEQVGEGNALLVMLNMHVGRLHQSDK
jgi:hypothetical protein